ncbi:CBS domain-containing protein [Massilia glaciei]|uniref:CBS domain-containing protein n=1 Tax=Massilia glaciei TaxID=1524097 RepID=A0A2U2HIX3_9BURK|nr:CBS domain-containing protein [Massilia glaciei]PWF46757.1 CBS domain-containing protein [Massilia glaciei]
MQDEYPELSLLDDALPELAPVPAEVVAPAPPAAMAAPPAPPAAAARPISFMMETNIKTVHAEDTVADVEQVLASNKFSSVPVVGSNGAIVGMISCQDLVMFHAEKKVAAAVRAWEISRINNFEVGPATPVLEVAKLMIAHRMQHVAVTEHGVLLGLVSAIDFVEQLVINEAA